MSEFSRYLLLREDVDVAVRFLEDEGATGLVLANQHAWTLVVTPLHEKFLARGRFQWISYDFAADHGFQLEVHEKGTCVARLHAASETERSWKFDRGEFVAQTLLSARSAVAIDARLKKNDWTHRDIRDLVAKEMGFEPIAFLRGKDLLDSVEDLEMRFPEGHLLIDGKVAESEDVEAILDAEKKQPAKTKAKPKAKVVMTRAEMEEIAIAFRKAPPPVERDAVMAGDVDLASEKTARGWLDAKKRVDPVKASAAVLRELERVIHENRFASDGDIALVAREAAAILLARCLKAQKRADAATYLASRASQARSSDEAKAWQVASKYFAKLDGKAARDD